MDFLILIHNYLNMCYECTSLACNKTKQNCCIATHVDGWMGHTNNAIFISFHFWHIWHEFHCVTCMPYCVKNVKLLQQISKPRDFGNRKCIWALGTSSQCMSLQPASHALSHCLHSKLDTNEKMERTILREYK